MVVELLSQAFTREDLSLEPYDVTKFTRLWGCLEKTISETSEVDTACNHDALAFLFRDLDQSPRMFILATIVLAFRVAAPIKSTLRLPENMERFHPALQAILRQLALKQGSITGGFHYLTTSLT